MGLGPETRPASLLPCCVTFCNGFSSLFLQFLLCLKVQNLGLSLEVLSKLFGNPCSGPSKVWDSPVPPSVAVATVLTGGSLNNCPMPMLCAGLKGPGAQAGSDIKNNTLPWGVLMLHSSGMWCERKGRVSRGQPG